MRSDLGCRWLKRSLKVLMWKLDIFEPIQSKLTNYDVLKVKHSICGKGFRAAPKPIMKPQDKSSAQYNTTVAAIIGQNPKP
ncbi:unnamed protein product [Dovyalis caffra]|uniref:Uncharacterized protein n=1 Tax=Dovyalis caffra TaxID=77055 RepID=A0AAV1RH95_9ROSI|nr:unnamed protein product [Dovyalis caffra]